MIRLPPPLHARLRALAKESGRSVHSLIVEGVERYAAYEEQMRRLVKEAMAAALAAGLEVGVVVRLDPPAAIALHQHLHQPCAQDAVRRQ